MPPGAVNTSVVVEALRSTILNVFPLWTNEKWFVSIHFGIDTVPPWVS